MLKKIMLGIVVTALLTGTGNLLAHEAKTGLSGKDKQPRAARKHQGRQPRQNQLTQQQQFDKWFDKLTKAYKNNDKEEVGSLNIINFRNDFATSDLLFSPEITSRTRNAFF